MVHPLAGHHGVYELRFAPNGRATFTFGPSVSEGQPHIIWRRIGGHEVLDRPLAREAAARIAGGPSGEHKSLRGLPQEVATSIHQ